MVWSVLLPLLPLLWLIFDFFVIHTAWRHRAQIGAGLRKLRGRSRLSDPQRIQQLEIELGFREPSDVPLLPPPPPPRIKAPPRKQPPPPPAPLPLQTEETWLTEISGKPWWESEAYKQQQRRKERDG